ncbi:MAG TPA: TonB-dependent receptor [Anaeromyxobacter sp.]
MLRRKVLRLATALGFVISSVAFAQDATTPPPAEPPPAAPPAAAPQSAVVGEQPAAAPAAKGPEERTEEIVVTGTRIRRKDLSTPAPVTVLSSEQLTSSGKVSIGDFLQTLPEQGGAINTQYNNGGDGTTEVSLRNLGSQRTLVLLNGRRFVAGGTSAQSTVDLNSIPTAAIERVEILKDGASAVYGSDAIAGVVNIITKKKLNGTEATAYAGETGHGDGTTYDVALTTGTSSDKGNLLFSAGFTKVDTIWAGDRPWAKHAILYSYNEADSGLPVGENAGGSSAIPQGRFGLGGYIISPTGGVCEYSSTAGGCAGADVASSSSIAAELLRSRLIDPAGNLQDPKNYRGLNFMYDPTRGAATGGYAPYSSAYSYNYQAVNYLVTPSQRVQLFSTGDANLGDVARAYFEASYVDRTSRTQIAPDPLFTGNYGVVVSKDSIFNPTGVDLFDVRRRLVEFGGRADDYSVQTFRTVFGLDGTIPDSVPVLKGWYWDASFNWGKTGGTDTNSGALRLPYVQDAVGPSMIDPTTGQAICVKTPGDPTTVIPGCAPLNLLHVSVPGHPELDAPAPGNLAFTGTNRARNQMQQFAANVTGELFRLADRPVSLALGGDYTQYSAALVVNTINVAGEGDNYNAADVAGSYNTTQGYAELQIPIMSNVVGAQELELDLAARAAHYNTFGDKTTYKAGVRYSPIRDVTLRGTFSTAYRAPSITNLFAGASENFPSVSDPCGNLAGASPTIIARCAGTGVTNPAGSGDDSTQLKEFIGGNVNVKPETANIFTIGVVLQPQMLRNFSATVDYFNTKISNTIGQVQAVNILSGCYGLGYQPYCAAIHRDPNTQMVTSIDDLITNYSKLDVQGIDVGVNYVQPTPVGKFGLNLNGSFLTKYQQDLPSGQVIDGKGNYDLGVNPSFKALVGLTYGLGGLGVGWTARYIGSYTECMNNNPADQNFGTATGGLCYQGNATFTDIGFAPREEHQVSAYFLHDLALRYGVKSSAGLTSLALGIQNIFDARPPRVYASFLSYAEYDYQFAGRAFYARLTQNF